MTSRRRTPGGGHSSTGRTERDPASDDAPVADEPISRERVEQTLAGLRRLLDQVAEDTMTAGSGTVARLEGAVAALEGLLAACGGAESGSARMGEEVQ